MAQLTAMQQIIEWAISLKDKEHQCIDWICIKNKAEELFPMEKEQIKFAYNDGAEHIVANKYISMEDYYNETYGEGKI